MDEAERSLLIQLGFVKFAIRFKSASGGIRVHHNSHHAREVAAFQVIASDADNGTMRARFRIVVLRDTNAHRIARWAYATKPLIEELVNAIIEVYRRFVFGVSYAGYYARERRNIPQFHFHEVQHNYRGSQ